MIRLRFTTPLHCLMALLALCWITAVDGREISAKRECSTCHVMWLDAFKQESSETLIPFNPRPLEPSGRQDVVSTERMCFSCHDGFVRDSRFVWAKREHFHPVGVVPSDKIQIPVKDGKQIFPLNDDGKVYCGTCHSAHGVNWDQGYSPIFLRAENVDSSFCLACHLERATGPKEGNHPVFRPMERRPPELEQAGAKFGRDNAVICQSCHRVHGAATARKLLVVDNTNSKLCGTCHDDRYTTTREEAAEKRTHPVNLRPDQAKVPQALLDAGGRLGESGEVICQTCHRPHNALPGEKILVSSNEDSALCQGCHERQREVKATRHNLARSQPDAVNVKDQPASKGVCSACHLPHRGTGPKMWARAPGQSEDGMAANCISCHQEGGPAEKKQVGKHSHPVGRAMGELNKGTPLPAFTPNGLRVKEGGQVTCPSCHDPHRWSPDGKVADPLKGDGDAGTSFLRRENMRGSALCLTCHKDKKALAGTAHDRSGMKLQAGLPEVTGVCDTCHRVHQGKGARMWALPPQPGLDPVSAICLSCHNPKGVAKKRTVGDHSHPVNVPIARAGIEATEKGWSTTRDNLFEKGELKRLPLFDDQGRQVNEGGNVTCASCHEPHGKTEANGRFLRVPNDSNASLCRTCHVDKGMVALSKHNLAISRPKAAKGKANVCVQCHKPHNAAGIRLFARPGGDGPDAVAGLCLSCHTEGGLARKKQIGQHSHPLGVDVKKINAKTSLPQFRADGARDAEAGRVSCPTCHNPHQWVPGEPRNKRGARADVEGTAADSFLRVAAAPDGALCIECHRDKRWVRQTDHDLRITAPNVPNDDGRTVKETGVCGQCHAVHNAKVRTRLWGRKTVPGQELMESLCLSCHAKEKVADAKIPKKLNHPRDVKVISVSGWPRPGKNLGNYPVYDGSGKVVKSGIISCPTCHNVHQWQSGLEQEGPGRKVEGSVMNSFLRNRSSFSLCTNCHGLDALFRYKYFHGESSRVPHRLYQ